MNKITNGTANKIAMSVLAVLLAVGIISSVSMNAQVKANTAILERHCKEVEKIADIQRDVAVTRAIVERMEKERNGQ